MSYFFGIVSDWPGRITVPEMLFALLIAETDAPVRFAIVESESPLLTTYRVDLGFGLVFALVLTTTALDFIFVDSDFAIVTG